MSVRFELIGRFNMRIFVGLAALGMAMICGSASAQEAGKKVTAREVVDAIKSHVGVEWKEKTVDTFKTGDPDTVVTGVAVTMMATLDVLQRAVAAGDNMVITHEPIFFNHMLEQAEGISLEELPVMPIYFYVSKGLVSTKVRGWQDNPLNAHYVRDLSLAD